MKKIPRTAKIGRGHRPSPIWLSEEFFESNYFQIDKHVVLLLINYIANQLLGIAQSFYTVSRRYEFHIRVNFMFEIVLAMRT